MTLGKDVLFYWLFHSSCNFCLIFHCFLLEGITKVTKGYLESGDLLYHTRYPTSSYQKLANARLHQIFAHIRHQFTRTCALVVVHSFRQAFFVFVVQTTELHCVVIYILIFSCFSAFQNFFLTLEMDERKSSRRQKTSRSEVEAIPRSGSRYVWIGNSTIQYIEGTFLFTREKIKANKQQLSILLKL